MERQAKKSSKCSINSLTELNRLIIECCTRVVDDSGSLTFPTSYSDKRLDHLLSHTEWAQVPDFRFVDRHGRPSKRVLLNWLIGRWQNKTPRHGKLYGFAQFITKLSWQASVHKLAKQFLEMPEVQRACNQLGKAGTIDRLVSSIGTSTISFQQPDVNVAPHFPQNYGIEYWHHTVHIHSNGDAEHDIKARIINLNKEELRNVAPWIATVNQLGIDELKPWAKVDKIACQARIPEWDGNRGRLYLDVPNLRQYRSSDLHWGYRTPGLGVPGDDSYYTFGIDARVFHQTGSLLFAANYTVSNVRTSTGVVRTSPTSIKWEEYFPSQGHARLDFCLARK